MNSIDELAPEPRLLQNALYFPAHDRYITSSSVHSWVRFEYLPGHKASTDGGLEYLHRTVTPPEHAHLVVPYDLSTDSPIEEIRERLLWGSLPRDKAAPPVYTYRPIRLLSRDHLRNILKSCPNASPLHREVIEYWLAKGA